MARSASGFYETARRTVRATPARLARGISNKSILFEIKYDYGKRFTSKKELVDMIENYIRYYNNHRIQRNLGILTPMEKHTLYLAA